MTPIEAWGIVSQCFDELMRLRKHVYSGTPGYSTEEISAQVITFEALRRMEKEYVKD